MNGGWMGIVLSVDLTKREIKKEELNPELARKYIGGVGLGMKWLYDEAQPGIHPFDPEMPLMFLTGPLTATAAPTSGGFSVVTFSPLTNTVAQANANGFFGYWLKSAGYDAIIFRGKSETPVYLLVNNEKVELRDASRVWGCNTNETDAKLKEETGLKGASVACIGVSGEKLVKYAAINADNGHFASSGGVGAVMGSKNLKAVVAFGNQKVPINDKQKETEAVKRWVERIDKTDGAQFLKGYGTGGGLSFYHSMGDLPIKNLTTNECDYADNISGIAIRTNYETHVKPCYKCPLNHVHCVKLPADKYNGISVEEAEFECIAGLGSMLGISDIVEILYLNHLLDDYAMDAKTITNVIGLCMECYEKDLLTKEQLGGIDLTWGNAVAVQELLKKINNREGYIGELLSEDIKTIALRIGGDAPKMAVHSKGGGLHVHDLRSLWGFGISHYFSDYSTTVGGGFCDLSPDAEYGYTAPLAYRSSEGHSLAMVKTQPKVSLADCLVICNFMLGNTGQPMNLAIDTLKAVTGIDYTIEEIEKNMRRVKNLARALNIRYGLTPEDDIPSERIMSAPVDGPAAGESIKPYIIGMRDEYYEYNGWDKETSKPLPKTLEDLDLDYVIEDIWR